MKTVKIAVITLVLAFAALSIVNADGFVKKPPAKKIIHVTLVQAVQNPDLVIAMYQQLDPSFLITNQYSYTKVVLFHNYLVSITGTHEQWVLFFRAKPNSE